MLSHSRLEKILLERLESLGLAEQLRLVDGQWELLSTRVGERPVRLDFAAELRMLKPSLLSLRQQPLYRALGSKGGVMPKVLDVTCGLAGDSLMLLAFGCSVVAWERHPLPALMLLRAYEVWQDPEKQRFELDLEPNHQLPEGVSVIYFDPMYNEGPSSALPRKEMRIFREVVGADQDAQTVAKALREHGKRLIVKRPPKAPRLMPGEAFSQEGKAVRFDVYLP